MTMNTKLKISLGDEALDGVLFDSPTARDFASLLPLSMSLKDFNRAEKISDLPKKLSTQQAPAGAEPVTGDIAYYVPWGNLALFYNGAPFANGLVIIGRIDGGTNVLQANDAIEARIEIIP